MDNRFNFRFSFIGIFILVSVSLVFSSDLEVRRQLSETNIGSNFNFEIECKDNTISVLKIMVHLSNSPVDDPIFKMKIWTYNGETGAYVKESPQTALSYTGPSADLGEDRVRLRKEGAGYRIRILFSYKPDCDDASIDYHKKITVTMEGLSGGHLQAYIHSYTMDYPEDEEDYPEDEEEDRCQELILLTDKVGFTKDPDEEKPMDVILVLDVSGSMRSGSPKKIDVLYDVTQDFLDIWAVTDVFKDNDHVGAVFFETTASPYLVSGNFLVHFGSNPTNPGSDWMQLYNEVGTRSTGSSTAMGEGLQEALNRFDNNSDNLRYIILFTNGMQCHGDLVEDSGPPDNLKMLKGRSLRSYGVPIYTIGTGAASGSTWGTLLEKIAIQTGAMTTFTTDPAIDLDSDFWEKLVDMLRNNTLEIIAINSGLINKGQGQVSHTFQVNRAAERGIFIVSWHAIDALDRNPMAITMEIVGPGSVGIVTQGEIRDRNHSHIRNIPFPLSGFPADAHEGEWRINVRKNLQGTSAYYHAALFVDEAQLHYLVGAAPRDYGTGENVLLTASLSIDGQPITNADSVQCYVTRPRLPLGLFLHQRNLSDSDLNNNPPGVHADNFPNRYSRKLYRLIVEQNLGYLLEPVKDSVPVRLFDSGDKEAHGDVIGGDGVYSALYKNTEIPGQYEFDFSIKGDHPDVGKYARTERSVALVRVKTADPHKSETNHDDLGGGNYLLMFVPADSFGNFLGPGYVENIKIIPSAGNVSSIEDKRENGTYTFLLSNVPPGTDPIITVTLLDEKLFAKPLSEWIPEKKWIVGAYSGKNVPHESLDNAYDSGLSFNAMLERLFSARFSAFAAVGYNTFTTDTVGLDDLKVFNFSGNIKLYPIIGTFQISIFGGAGYYFLDPGEDRFGLNAGAAAEYRITTRLSFEAKYNYNYIFTSGDKTIFSTAQGGLRFRF